MTIGALPTSLDDPFDKARLRRAVFLIRPPTTENLLLGTTLLAPLIDSLHQIHCAAYFELDLTSAFIYSAVISECLNVDD